MPWRRREEACCLPPPIDAGATTYPCLPLVRSPPACAAMLLCPAAMPLLPRCAPCPAGLLRATCKPPQLYFCSRVCQDSLRSGCGVPFQCGRKVSPDPALDVLHHHALVDVVEKIVKPSFVKL